MGWAIVTLCNGYWTLNSLQLVCWWLASLQRFHSEGWTARSHPDGLRPHRCAETALLPAVVPSNRSQQLLTTEGNFLCWKKAAMQLKEAHLRLAASHTLSHRRHFWQLLPTSLPVSSSLSELSPAAFPSVFAQLPAQSAGRLRQPKGRAGSPCWGWPLPPCSAEAERHAKGHWHSKEEWGGKACLLFYFYKSY